MRRLLVSSVLLCCMRYAAVQAQTVTWKFPTAGENLTPNFNDTLLLDWTSTYATSILRMWCTNGTDGVTQDLASSFDVDSTGPFPYILEKYDPGEPSFPLLCHAEIAPDPLGAGIDSPAGITWHSDPAVAAKTISQTQTVSTSATVTTTSSSTISTTSSLVQSTTPTPSIKQTTTSSGSPSGATKSPQSSTPASSNNTGPIVGGVIGGLALVSFIVLALLFLRKYRRDHSASSLGSTEPSKGGFSLSNLYKKGGLGATGVFEKEGDNGAYEADGTGLSERNKVPELQGSAASRSGDGAIRYHPVSPVELPDHSNYA